MIQKCVHWFRRNAYGIFILRLLIALGAAIVSLLLSLLPHDAILQAAWVTLSSLFAGTLVLRSRLNETDDARYRRLFRNRFGFLQANDPEALTTVFAENIRPRVLQWFENEHHIPALQAPSIDALDSLARSGDTPGQLIFRTGVELGKWLHESHGCQPDQRLDHLQNWLTKFVEDNGHLMGQQIADGLYLRHIRSGEQRPVGIHMFHPHSQLLLTVEHYPTNSSGQTRHSLALSVRSHLIDQTNEQQWDTFRQQVHQEFPEFRPAEGGSGPQRASIPYFVGAIHDAQPADDQILAERLQRIHRHLPADQSSDTDTPAEERSSEPAPDKEPDVADR